ncbi:MAG TPA: type II toxin-antitoxin system VapC family toxin [Solirubrobacteraceae bacterium]|nr:type II toxin-antitoxin system VapC family toxin [Solirubrobacteraceae bacterium]
MSAEGRLYLDSSAIVKLAIEEPESAALRRALRGTNALSSCALAMVEVAHAVAPHGEDALLRAQSLLAAFELARLDEDLIERAAALARGALRTLDALHLAAASAMAEDLGALVTYDRRMAQAARGLGLRVRMPGAGRVTR